MRILVLADVESKYLWDYFEKEKLDGIDLILSCGDLKPQYLSFLASFSKVPILYVHGNHDDCYEIAPPDGCICIENKIYVYRGVRIMGLGGSIRYNNGKNQYTQAQMKQRVRTMAGVNDGEDHVHKGFDAFVDILDEYQPKYFIHGHVHKSYSNGFKREDKYKNTVVINGYDRYIIDVDI